MMVTLMVNRVGRTLAEESGWADGATGSDEGAGNPVHAWEAIATARAYSVRMPKWVVEYPVGSQWILLNPRETR